MHCYLVRLGQVEYRAAWQLQRQLADARAAGRIADALLVLEHPHTYTLGRSARAEHLLMGEAERIRRGVTVVQVDRGGSITYHGPGQLVAYPILYLGRVDLTGHLAQTDYVGYIRRLEEVIIRALKPWGIPAHREPGFTGAWIDTPTGSHKIAAIGVRVSAQGVSTHGLALNVTTDLSYFAGIIPCGIPDKPVTSMQALLGADTPPMSAVLDSLEAAFADVFGYQLVPVDLDDLPTGQATHRSLLLCNPAQDEEWRA